jgi:nucleotide-binding universal stress UspA family protein
MPTKILIALDRTEYAEIVLEHGLDAAMRDPAAELHFVSAVSDERGDADAATASVDQLVRDGLDAFGIPDRPVVLHVRRGRPAPVVAALAAELPADVLVLGRFHVPSDADVIASIVDCPTLVVGIAGTELEPQCPACEAVRRTSDGEQLFCAQHTGEHLPDLVTRLPPSVVMPSRMW